MKILLDNNVPRTLKRSLARPHNVLHCCVLDAKRNDPMEVLTFADAIREALPTAPPGTYTWVRKPNLLP